MTKSSTAKTAAYYLSFTIVGMTTAAFGPSIPAIASSTSSALGTVGGLFVFHRIGYIVGSLTGGRILDRVAGKYVVAATMGLLATGLFLLPQWALIAGVFATVAGLGLAQGTTEVAANTGVVWIHKERAGPIMNGLHLSFGVGAVVAPIVISQSVSKAGGLLPGYTVLAVVAALGTLWWLRLPAEERERSTAEGSHGIPEPFLVILSSALLFLIIAGEAGFAGWIYSYVLRKGLMPPTEAGYLNSTFWAALTFGRLVGIELVRRWGARRLISVSLLGCLVSMAVFAAFGGTSGGIWAVALLLGLSQSSIVPTVFTLAGEARILTGSVGGIFVASSAAGGMTLPWIAGQLFESRGPESLVWLVAGSQVLAFLVYLGINLKLKNLRR
jgi:MFS transporter, FHS family, Na+ dependent glucose transporter 1